MTSYPQIEKWWEVVMSAYLLVSLHTSALRPNNADDACKDDSNFCEVKEAFSSHQYWNQGKGWKSRLNNLRLVLQPYVYFNLLRPWLAVFSIPSLSNGFSKLLKLMDCLPGAILSYSRDAPTAIFSG